MGWGWGVGGVWAACLSSRPIDRTNGGVLAEDQ